MTIIYYWPNTGQSLFMIPNGYWSNNNLPFLLIINSYKSNKNNSLRLMVINTAIIIH